MKISWTKQAKEDLDLILLQMERVSPVYASNFDEKVRNIIGLLKKFPKSGRSVLEIQNDRIREKIVGKYRLIYFLETDELLKILAIYHGSRNFTL